MRHCVLALNVSREVDSVSDVQLARPGFRVLVIVAAIVVGGIAIVLWRHTPVGDTDLPSVGYAAPKTVSLPTATMSPVDSTSAGFGRRDDVLQSAAAGSAARYPVDLDVLRRELPNNRYWEDGAPTSDPEVAKARAARAEAGNARLGRIQANEAPPEEIRAYYADRRALSRDYLALAEHVLATRGAALPERDRGMFELSVQLHRDRLRQIDRDESDALGRWATRTGSGGGGGGSDGSGGGGSDGSGGSGHDSGSGSGGGGSGSDGSGGSGHDSGATGNAGSDNAIGGSAIGGSAIGGSAIGGSAIGGSAIGGSHVSGATDSDGSGASGATDSDRSGAGGGAGRDG